MEQGERAAALREEGLQWRDGPSLGGTVGPGSVYEAVTRQMVEGLAEEIAEIKGRLNGLLFMLAGAIVVDVALRLAGVE